MLLVKYCKACGTANAPEEMMCRNCLADVSAIAPLMDIEKNNSEVHKEKRLTLITESYKLEIYNKDIIGREGKWRDYLISYKTISRKHAMFIYEGGEWYVEDLDSANGTFVNGKQLDPNRKELIKDNDVIGFSRGFFVSIKVE